LSELAPESSLIAGVDDPAILRRGFTLYPRGVMAVAAEIDGAPVGLAVSAFVSVSLDPPLMLLCVDAASRTWPTLSTSPGIGVSVIAEDQAWLGRQLASRSRDRFADATFERRPSGALLLDGAVAVFDCTVHSVLEGGDHLMVLLNVVDMRGDASVRPLVWHDSGFAGLDTPPA
jgi:flavin reductase (DIM6/NTAB) family NADH-FMN oxidoreductase RutF